MAAPSKEHVKLSKQQRLARKKENKAKHVLFRHENITTVETPTRNLVIGNGGLGNDVQRQELYTLFSKYGQIQDIVMKQKKPYSFITFLNVEDAKHSLENVNGRELKSPEELSRPGVKFYISYLEIVPDIDVDNERVPPGLVILPDFVTSEQEKTLLLSINWKYKDPKLSEDGRKPLKHRQVQHYGYEFRYDTNNVDKTNPLECGIPDECHSVVDAIMSTGNVTVRPDQLTINEYIPGQGIPPHVDTHSAFTDEIVSLSLGSQIVMNFHHPGGTCVDVLVPRRALIIMTGESRFLWSHGITPRKSDVTVETNCQNQRRLTQIKRDTRTSFTFRALRHEPCQCKYPQKCDSQKNLSKTSNLSMPTTEPDASQLEQQHVHQVYDVIAGHFSDTRHTPWPQVTDFLKRLQPGSIVTDIGCGNGKYMGINPSVFMLGNDRSVNLCGICAERGYQVFPCDILSIPLRDDCCDAAICIAVIHHLSTQERRLAALTEITRLLRRGGKALIYVWALEQEKDNVKSNYLSERKIKENDSVPSLDSMCESGTGERSIAVQSQKAVSAHSTSKQIPPSDFAGQSSDCASQRAVECTNHGTSVSGNDCAAEEGYTNQCLTIHDNRTHFKTQDLLVPWHLKGKQSKQCTPTGDEVNPSGNTSVDSPVYHRYYHVFKEQELDKICSEISDVKVVHSYYDKGNWCVIFEKIPAE